MIPLSSRLNRFPFTAGHTLPIRCADPVFGGGEAPRPALLPTPLGRRFGSASPPRLGLLFERTEKRSYAQLRSVGTVLSVTRCRHGAWLPARDASRGGPRRNGWWRSRAPEDAAGPRALGNRIVAYYGSPAHAVAVEMHERSPRREHRAQGVGVAMISAVVCLFACSDEREVDAEDASASVGPDAERRGYHDCEDESEDQRQNPDVVVHEASARDVTLGARQVRGWTTRCRCGEHDARSA